MRIRYLPFLGLWFALILSSAGVAQSYDVILRGGTVYDGSGNAPRVTDVAIRGDRVAAMGDLAAAQAKLDLDVTGLAVAPGFVNVLSWATDSLIEDGRSQSDIRQGVTLEVMGEGSSMGPLNAAMKQEAIDQQGDIKYPIPWTTLGEYLEHLERKGVSCNVASFVGAATVRVHELGYADREPSAEELERMKALVRQAMDEGAMGVASALIYAPGFYAKTAELIELCKVAGECGGMYISHLRSEGSRLEQGVDELITIAREANLPAEIYHLKAAGKANWHKLDSVIAKVDAARVAGLRITADMYTYTAGATGLDAAMPPWVQEGGLEAWIERLKDPAIRARVIAEMSMPADDWENFFVGSGPDGMLLCSFDNHALRGYVGKTLSEVATLRGKTPAETALDLVIEDHTRVGVIYALMSEENVTAKMRLSWVSFCSDAGSMAPEGKFLGSNPHPRAYGSFARVLGKYARDEKVLSLSEAVRRLSVLPAENLGLRNRDVLTPGRFADIAVFDPETIADHATFAEPHQYATGMVHVFVNGTQVLSDGEHTGAMPGRVVRGPGWVGWKK